MSDREMPAAGQLYQHFKGMMYQIMGVAKHSETMELLVVYQALYGDYSLYVRPLGMFLSEVDHEKYPNVTAKYRFTKVDRASLDGSKHSQTAVNKDSSTAAGDVKQQNKSSVQQTNENQQSSIRDAQQSSMNVDMQTSVNVENAAVSSDFTHPEADLVNQDLMEFLDAKDYGEKLEVLYNIRKRLDDRSMCAIELSMDLPAGHGSIDERVNLVRENLTTMAKFETRRLR